MNDQYVSYMGGKEALEVNINHRLSPPLHTHPIFLMDEKGKKKSRVKTILKVEHYHCLRHMLTSEPRPVCSEEVKRTLRIEMHSKACTELSLNLRSRKNWGKNVKMSLSFSWWIKRKPNPVATRESSEQLTAEPPSPM